MFFHAKLIGLLTLLSRVLGLVREVVAGHYLGTGMVASAFTVAFTIPNLFRKLLGEGALSQAFIPLYAQAIRKGQTADGENAGDFAAASVKLLTQILIAITVVGEAIIGICMFLARHSPRADRMLMLQFAAIMLPYVMLVCGGAFLAGILQVHKRFGAPAFAPVLLNLCHILVVFGGAWFLGMDVHREMSDAVIHRQSQLAFALAVTVLIAGALQVAILLPGLRDVGFRFRWSLPAWTPATRRMLKLSIPVALGAAVLQISVLLDKGISYALMQGPDESGQMLTQFHFLSRVVPYPMEMGAVRRLELAQLLYQFPLGVFAIALATAIFPSLSAEAFEVDRDKFKRVMRQGIEVVLWEGLPASIGLILVAEPAVRLLFQHGRTSFADATLITHSAMVYAGGIWAYSLLQIINRGYYALHDTRTPLIASVLNIVINLVVEIPLLWKFGEVAMAVGTLLSFAIQAIVMLWLLHRRVGGLGLRESMPKVVKMSIATAIMTGVCYSLTRLPFFPRGDTQSIWLMQLLMIAGIGAGVYIIACKLMRLDLKMRVKNA